MDLSELNGDLPPDRDTIQSKTNLHTEKKQISTVHTRAISVASKLPRDDSNTSLKKREHILPKIITANVDDIVKSPTSVPDV